MDAYSGGVLQSAAQTAQALQAVEQNKMLMQQQQQEFQRQQQMNQRQDEGDVLLEQFTQGYQAGKPDYNLLITAAYKSPNTAKNVLAGVGIVDKQQKTRAANDIVTGLAAIKSKDKKAVAQWAAKRISESKASNNDPKDTQELTKMALAGDWDGAANSLMTVGAALANEGYIKPELIGIGQQAVITPYQQANLDLRAREVAAAETRANRPDTQVTIDNKQDTEIDKLSAKDYQGLIANATRANKEIATIDTLENLSDKAFSGAGAGALLAGAKILKQAGIETEGLTESEVYEKVANTLVLDKSQQMSGALSNGDMVFLQNTVPNLTTSKEGRKLTFDISKKLAQREKEVAKLATQFRRDNKGKFDSGEFQMFLDNWKEQNPLFESSKQDAAPSDTNGGQVIEWSQLNGR